MFNLKSIILLIFILFFSLPLSSQNKNQWKDKTPEEIAEIRASRLKEKLTLDDYQYKQIYEILFTTISEIKTLREQKNSSSDVDKKSIREKIQTLRKETHDKIVAVLKPEQRNKFEEMKKNRMEKRKSKGKREKEEKKSNW